MQNFIKEFNLTHQATATNKYPPRIYNNELKKGHLYKIVEMVYVKTPYHDKSVVLRIQDEYQNNRSYFLSERYASIIRQHFTNPEDMETYELFMVFQGYSDEAKQIGAIIEITYMGDAQN